MPPRRYKTGPAGLAPPGRQVESVTRIASAIPATETTPAPVTLPRDVDIPADLDAWCAAVEYLHSHGLPAAVPELIAARLRRQDIRADWAHGGRWAA